MSGKVGMWIALAFLVVIAIGGYAFYQKGANEIDHMNRVHHEVCDDGSTAAKIVCDN
jgi:hypothetical protein